MARVPTARRLKIRHFQHHVPEPQHFRRRHRRPLAGIDAQDIARLVPIQRRSVRQRLGIGLSADHLDPKSRRVGQSQYFASPPAYCSGLLLLHWADGLAFPDRRTWIPSARSRRNVACPRAAPGSRSVRCRCRAETACQPYGMQRPSRSRSESARPSPDRAVRRSGTQDFVH